MTYAPDFFLVGAAKAGTTALQQALDTHPEIYMSPLKEPNYFCDDIKVETLRKNVQKKIEADNIPLWIKQGMKGFRWRAYLRDENLYKKLFDFARADQQKGEASVSYLYSKNASARIYEANPNAKIIIVLRNPVERAFSHFKMEKRMGWLQENLSSAFERHKTNKQPKWGCDPLFLAGGLYAEQVERFHTKFPSNQLNIVWYEDLKKDPSGTLKKMFTFLGVDPTRIDTSTVMTKSNEALENKLEAIHQALIPGATKVRFRRLLRKLGLHGHLKTHLTKPDESKLSEEECSLLSEYYYDDIIQLENLLSVNLTAWKK